MEETKQAIQLIAEERQRQIEKEGWNIEHDNQHLDQSLAIAASIYAMPEYKRAIKSVPNTITERGYIEVPKKWPWAIEYWKPTPEDRVRELVKSGALIVAEIERLQRLTSPTKQ